MSPISAPLPNTQNVFFLVVVLLLSLEFLIFSPGR